MFQLVVATGGALSSVRRRTSYLITGLVISSKKLFSLLLYGRPFVSKLVMTTLCKKWVTSCDELLDNCDTLRDYCDTSRDNCDTSHDELHTSRDNTTQRHCTARTRCCIVWRTSSTVMCTLHPQSAAIKQSRKPHLSAKGNPCSTCISSSSWGLNIWRACNDKTSVGQDIS